MSQDDSGASYARYRETDAYRETQAQPELDRVLAVIREAGPDGVSRSTLYTQHRAYGATVDALLQRKVIDDHVIGVEHRVRE